MAAQPSGGRLSAVLRNLFMRRATVIACEPVGEPFHLLTLEGPTLRGTLWTPGQKVQVAMGEGLVTRTYTPMDWDAAAGRTRILCCLRAGGPGSAWARSVREGDDCEIFGPRPSIEPPAPPRPLAVFGDETSFGLAHAFAARDRATACHFEVRDADACREVMQRLDLAGAQLHPAQADEAHIGRMAAAARALAAAGSAFVLTGRAAMVQALRQALKQAEVPAALIRTKAYWAPGKVGLD